MSNKRKISISNFLYLIIVLIIFFVIFAVIWNFTNGFNEDFKTFYVEYNGNKIITTKSDLILEQGKEHRFDVKYTFDILDTEPRGYKVKIIPNDEIELNFTVDDEEYSYSDETELTQAFEIEYDEAYFILKIPDGFSLFSLLSKLYEGKTIGIPDNSDNLYLYTLVISSYNENVTYYINFTCLEEKHNTAQEYSINLQLTGDATNLVDISVEYPKTALAGETVTFTISHNDSDYEINDIKIIVLNGDNPKVTNIGGSYSFTMPNGNVTIMINLEYSEQYSIEYSVLGNGSENSVNVDCPSHAAAGTTVTFTLTLLDDSLEITNIVLYALETDEEFYYFDNIGEGEFSFIMPDFSITILIYLMTI